MLSVGFFAEVKKFCILLTASECFLPFAWSVKVDQPAIDNANVLLHTEHQALALLFLSFCTQSLRSRSLSQILKSSLLSPFSKKAYFPAFPAFPAPVVTLLLQAANDSPFNSIPFDESSNSNLQQCQMDVHVNFGIQPLKKLYHTTGRLSF